MIKLNYDKANINVNKLHGELGDLGEQYLVTHDEAQINLIFTDLFEMIQEVEDADPITEYTKRIITFDEEDAEVETFDPYDIAPLKAQIQAVIAAHDPTPPAQPPTDQERIAELENMILFILGGV